MTARTIANRLLEAEPEDIDPGAELTRLSTSQYPGYEIEMEGNHWNVYKQWRGSQHFIGEIYYDDMSDMPRETMTPEAIASWDAHRWMSIAGFRESEFKACKSFNEAIQWIIAVNIAKTTPVREAVDPDDPKANIERFAQERSTPVETEITNLEGRRFRVQIVWDQAAGGTAYDAEGNEVVEKLQPIVQFYDMTHANDPKYARSSFKDKGQFVSSYYASTLVERPAHTGLDLYGGEPLWQIDWRSMDMIIGWIKEQVESRGYKLKDDLFGKTYEGLDPDDPELYTHPEKFSQQPSYEKIESDLRVMLAPYYSRVNVNRRPGMFNTAGSLTRMSKPTSAGPFQNSYVWTIHCNRDTPLPLSVANRNLPGYNLDWRQEVKHWFEKWAARHNLSLLKFEIYGRLRKDPTFQFETVSFGPLKEALDPYDEPEKYLPVYMDRQREVLEQRLMEDLWKWHPYGVGYNGVISPNVAMITAQTYFPPEKDHFALRFREFVIDWFTKNKVMAIHFDKLTAGGGHDKHYPRWSVFLALNADWPPDEPAYVEPPVQPGAGAPVEVGQA